VTPQFLLKSVKISKNFQNLAEKFVKTASTIYKQPVNQILPALIAIEL